MQGRSLLLQSGIMPSPPLKLLWLARLCDAAAQADVDRSPDAARHRGQRRRCFLSPGPSITCHINEMNADARSRSTLRGLSSRACRLCVSCYCDSVYSRHCRVQIVCIISERLIDSAHSQEADRRCPIGSARILFKKS